MLGKEGCVKLKMEINIFTSTSAWTNHFHKLDNASDQWKIESTLGHKLALDSLHSHGPNLGRGYHLPPYSKF
jgi:hypothetical protein